MEYLQFKVIDQACIGIMLEEACISTMDRLQYKGDIDDDLISSIFDSMKKKIVLCSTGITGDMLPVLFGQTTPKYLYHLVYRGNLILLLYNCCDQVFTQIYW